MDDWLCGVVPVLPTPFTDDGEVDLASFDRVVCHAASLPIKACMYPGIASEHSALTDNEKRELTIRTSVAATELGLRLIASISNYSTDVAVVHARTLADTVALSAVNVLPSSACQTSEDLAQLYSEIAEAIDPIPVILQYAPEQMRARISMDELASLARTHENIVAVKVESSPCDVAVEQLLRSNSTLLALVGNAGLDLLPALRAGAVAVQPGPDSSKSMSASSMPGTAAPSERR